MNPWKCIRATAALLIALLLSPILNSQTKAPSPADAAVLTQQGKFAEAAEAWRAIIKRSPSDAGALASLGFVLSREEK